MLGSVKPIPFLPFTADKKRGELMPLKIVRQDITKIKCDAIVNPSNRRLKPDGGADLSIHQAAGPELLRACEALGGCEVGKAKITPAFRLPCQYVIHTAGPDWHLFKRPQKALASCYEECLKLAKEYNCESVAFPLISSGAYGFPKEDALKIATKVISDFLFANEMLVYLVVYDKNAFGISKKIFYEVKSYIDDNYVAVQYKNNRADAGQRPRYYQSEPSPQCYSEASVNMPASPSIDYQTPPPKYCSPKLASEEQVVSAPMPMPSSSAPSLSLDEMLKNMDKGFADTLFSYIDQKGLTDVECYKRSNVDKKTFSKIKCNKYHRPSKITAISFAIGMKLNLEETNHLLSTAGFCLSKSNMFDVIINYFVTTGNYENIFDVNEVLYQFDQVTLGV